MHKIFIIHSDDREDSNLCVELVQHLTDFKVFYNKSVQLGQNALAEKEKALRQSQLILVLVSSDFAVCNHCSHLLQIALEVCQQQPKVKLVPVLARHYDWESMDEICHLSPIPANKKFLTTWSNKDEAFYLAARAIRGLLGQVNRVGTKLGQLLFHSCDRIQQCQRFNIAFWQNQQQHPLQFFVTNAENTDSPDSLVVRFREEFIRAQLKGTLLYKRIDQSLQRSNLQDSQLAFQYNLANAFSLGSAFSHQLSAMQLAKLVQQRHYKTVIVSHQIDLHHWDQPTIHFLKWLLHQFWTGMEQHIETPHFAVFLNIMYSNIQWKGLAGFMPFLQKGKIKQIKRQLPTLLQSTQPITFLPDLNKISRDDVIQWAKKYELYYGMSALVEDFCQQIFKSSPKVPMQEIIPYLEKIIHHNRNSLQYEQ